MFHPTSSSPAARWNLPPAASAALKHTGSCRSEFRHNIIQAIPFYQEFRTRQFLFNTNFYKGSKLNVYKQLWHHQGRKEKIWYKNGLWPSIEALYEEVCRHFLATISPDATVREALLQSFKPPSHLIGPEIAKNIQTWLRLFASTFVNLFARHFLSASCLSVSWVFFTHDLPGWSDASGEWRVLQRQQRANCFLRMGASGTCAAPGVAGLKHNFYSPIFNALVSSGKTFSVGNSIDIELPWHLFLFSLLMSSSFSKTWLISSSLSCFMPSPENIADLSFQDTGAVDLSSGFRQGVGRTDGLVSKGTLFLPSL